VTSKLTHHDDIGYVVVAINPHGSTGYGQDFCDSIHSPRNDWGGKPFRDLVAGLQHVLDIYPAVDRERLVAAGGSYGGYMINWLQGHNSHTNFKAMVNHDGVFGKPKRPRQLAAMPYSN
jgi:dipeptidyl aminopeptidase/acylaminoacyl peptidase